MKRPIFNQIERQIMRESNSWYSDRMKFTIEVKKFEREISKSMLFAACQKIVNYLQTTFYTKK
jgi:hypothetical protein